MNHSIILNVPSLRILDHPPVRHPFEDDVLSHMFDPLPISRDQRKRVAERNYAEHLRRDGRRVDGKLVNRYVSPM